MARPSDVRDAPVVRPCLQCRAAVEFDPEAATARRGHVRRARAACPRCGAVHCLLPDWDVYGLVSAGRR